LVNAWDTECAPPGFTRTTPRTRPDLGFGGQGSDSGVGGSRFRVSGFYVRATALPHDSLALMESGWLNISHREVTMCNKAPGLVFKAHRLFYHSTLGLRVIKKKKKPLETAFRAYVLDELG